MPRKTLKRKNRRQRFRGGKSIHRKNPDMMINKTIINEIGTVRVPDVQERRPRSPRSPRYPISPRNNNNNNNNNDNNNNNNPISVLSNW